MLQQSLSPVDPTAALAQQQLAGTPSCAYQWSPAPNQQATALEHSQQEMWQSASQSQPGQWDHGMAAMQMSSQQGSCPADRLPQQWRQQQQQQQTFLQMQSSPSNFPTITPALAATPPTLPDNVSTPTSQSFVSTPGSALAPAAGFSAPTLQNPLNPLQTFAATAPMPTNSAASVGTVGAARRTITTHSMGAMQLPPPMPPPAGACIGTGGGGSAGASVGRTTSLIPHLVTPAGPWSIFDVISQAHDMISSQQGGQQQNGAQQQDWLWPPGYVLAGQPSGGGALEALDAAPVGAGSGVITAVLGAGASTPGAGAQMVAGTLAAAGVPPQASAHTAHPPASIVARQVTTPGPTAAPPPYVASADLIMPPLAPASGPALSAPSLVAPYTCQQQGALNDTGHSSGPAQSTPGTGIMMMPSAGMPTGIVPVPQQPPGLPAGMSQAQALSVCPPQPSSTPGAPGAAAAGAAQPASPSWVSSSMGFNGPAGAGAGATSCLIQPQHVFGAK